MIFGVGIDAVNINRMQNNIDRFGNRFARKILGQSELEEYSNICNQAGFLAKHFAVKEAVSKALGTGMRNGVTFKDINLIHDNTGKPEIICNGYTKQMFETKKIIKSHLSISDENDYAFAFVVLESI